MSKARETIQIANRVVEIGMRLFYVCSIKFDLTPDEVEYIKQIEKLLGHPLLLGKIPGPFKDQPKFAGIPGDIVCFSIFGLTL
jgi:hypothetical protein